MKKKIATLLMFMFICLSLFTGCNLWSSNNYSRLDEIVATNGDIQITREELITAFNSSGYNYYTNYGLTLKEAVEKTIDGLISRRYLLNHIEEISKTDSKYKLTEQEEYAVIKETWSYIDDSISSIVDQVKKELNISSTDLSTEEENKNDSTYSSKSAYTTKFEKDEQGRIIVIENKENIYVPDGGKSVYNYELRLSSTNKDYETIVWNRYISSLKKAQQSYNYKDTTSDATFKREIDKVYKTNLENKKITKFEEIYKSRFGAEDYTKTTDENGNAIDPKIVYYLNNETLKNVATQYNQMYASNKEQYNTNKELFYKSLTNSSTRENYLYYGEPTDDEKLLTCMHVLIKFSDAQTSKIEEIKNDQFIKNYEDVVASRVAQEKDKSNTYAYARTDDPKNEGKMIESKTGTNVNDVWNEIKTEIGRIGLDTRHPDYLNKVIAVFDKFVYKYNQDPGIINAKYDYVVGTKTSAMVESFTEIVRTLYNGKNGTMTYASTNSEVADKYKVEFPFGIGYAGAISGPFLEESSSYSGYHIVLFTGILSNTNPTTITDSNVFDKLSEIKTSTAYNQTIFELVYEKVAKDSYTSYQNNLINSLIKNTIYNSSKYSDLLNG